MFFYSSGECILDLYVFFCFFFNFRVYSGGFGLNEGTLCE